MTNTWAFSAIKFISYLFQSADVGWNSVLFGLVVSCSSMHRNGIRRSSYVHQRCLLLPNLDAARFPVSISYCPMTHATFQRHVAILNTYLRPWDFASSGSATFCLVHRGLVGMRGHNCQAKVQAETTRPQLWWLIADTQDKMSCMQHCGREYRQSGRRLGITELGGVPVCLAKIMAKIIKWITTCEKRIPNISTNRKYWNTITAI